eukprot:Opistho-2@2378
MSAHSPDRGCRLCGRSHRRMCAVVLAIALSQCALYLLLSRNDLTLIRSTLNHSVIPSVFMDTSIALPAMPSPLLVSVLESPTMPRRDIDRVGAVEKFVVSSTDDAVAARTADSQLSPADSEDSVGALYSAETHMQSPRIGGEGNVLPSRRYLIPVHNLFQDGPNNQYYNFVETVKFARALNRTIVTMPFVDHAMHRTRNGDMPLKPFNLTFNEDHLQKSGVLLEGGLSSVAEVRAFLASLSTGPVIDVCWIFRPSGRIYSIAKSVVGAQQNCASLVAVRPSFVSAAAIRGALGEQHLNAPVVLMDHLFLQDDMYRVNRRSLVHRATQYRDEHLLVMRAMVPHADVLHNATRFIQSAFAGKPFVSVHWRRADRTVQNCTTYMVCTDAVNITELLDVIDSACHAARSAGSLPHSTSPLIYLAVLRISEEDLSLFGSRGYTQVVRYEPSVDEDPYCVSLVEQEICHRGVAFVGSLDSTWSCWVIETRIVRGVRLSWSTGQLTSDGRAGVRYERPPVSASFYNSTVCGYEYMGISTEPPVVMSLKCPPGHHISDVIFASFGAPGGVCHRFHVDPLCHDKESAKIVAGLCVGRAECELPVTSAEGAGGFGLRWCKTGGFALAVTLACTAGV